MIDDMLYASSEVGAHQAKRQTISRALAVSSLSPIWGRPSTLVPNTIGTGCGVHLLLLTMELGLTVFLRG